jgi:DNA-binding XRE family transcriptional regulator
MFATKVRSIRIQNKLTSRQMAQALGLNHDSYVDLEMGARDPQIADIEAILKAFPDMQLTDLMTIHTIDSAPLEAILISEFNRFAQHFYSQTGELQRSNQAIERLKREMQIYDDRFNQYIALLPILRNVPPDIIQKLGDPENEDLHTLVRTLLSGGGT